MRFLLFFLIVINTFAYNYCERKIKIDNSKSYESLFVDLKYVCIQGKEYIRYAFTVGRGMNGISLIPTKKLCGCKKIKIKKGFLMGYEEKYVEYTINP